MVSGCTVRLFMKLALGFCHTRDIPGSCGFVGSVRLGGGHGEFIVQSTVELVRVARPM